MLTPRGTASAPHRGGIDGTFYSEEQVDPGEGHQLHLLCRGPVLATAQVASPNGPQSLRGSRTIARPRCRRAGYDASVGVRGPDAGGTGIAEATEQWRGDGATRRYRSEHNRDSAGSSTAGRHCLDASAILTSATHHNRGPCSPAPAPGARSERRSTPAPVDDPDHAGAAGHRRFKPAPRRAACSAPSR